MQKIKKYSKTIIAVITLYIFAVYFVKPLLVQTEGDVTHLIMLYIRIWGFFIKSAFDLTVFEQFIILPFFLIWLFIHWLIPWSLRNAGIK